MAKEDQSVCVCVCGKKQHSSSDGKIQSDNGFHFIWHLKIELFYLKVVSSIERSGAKILCTYPFTWTKKNTHSVQWEKKINGKGKKGRIKEQKTKERAFSYER